MKTRPPNRRRWLLAKALEAGASLGDALRLAKEAEDWLAGDDLTKPVPLGKQNGHAVEPEESP